MNNWRIIPLTIADQQQHIELSEQLLATIAPDDPASLFWSMANRESLVLGFSQKPELLNAEAVTASGIPIYHRRAGGTAVLVGPHMLSLDIVLPANHPLVLRDVVESYRWLGETWVETLHQLGVQSRTVPPTEAHSQRARLKLPAIREYEMLLQRACYGSYSSYEVVVGQRKIVGLDMIRRRVGSLLQAGVLLHWETNTLAKLLGNTPEEQALLCEGLYERAVGIDTLAGRVITAEELITTFEKVMHNHYDLDSVHYAASRNM
ncbi:MAG: lipoate--protein ligase family protein [Ktedonobacteraceae bacterium]